MAEFMLQERAETSPRHCYFCQSFEGPFINTMTLDQAGQTILLCAPQAKGRRDTGCAGQIVHLIGGLTPKGAANVNRQRRDALVALEAAEQRLRDLRDAAVEIVG